jgi:hypothetical protein
MLAAQLYKVFVTSGYPNYSRACTCTVHSRVEIYIKLIKSQSYRSKRRALKRRGCKGNYLIKSHICAYSVISSHASTMEQENNHHDEVEAIPVHHLWLALAWNNR